MTEANQPMSPVERVAAVLLVSILVALVLNGEARTRHWTTVTTHAEWADQFGCSRLHTCMYREAHLLRHLRDCVRAADGPCVASAERDLIATREALGRFSAEDDVELSGEADSHGFRADAMDELANEHARLSPAERNAVEATY